MAPRLITRSKPVRFIDFTDEIKKSFEIRETPKKSRTKLETWQISALEKAYDDDSHPSQKAKTRLSTALGLQIKSIQIWFQNKRAKEKSKKEQSETEGEAPSFSAEDSLQNSSLYSIKPSSDSSEVCSINDSFVLSPAQDKAAPAPRTADHPLSLYDHDESSYFSMTYDECYTSGSSIFDQASADTCSEYDSFISSFSSPIVCSSSFSRRSTFSPENSGNPGNRVESPAYGHFKKIEGSSGRQSLFHGSSQYRCHLFDGRITYKSDDSSA